VTANARSLISEFFSEPVKTGVDSKCYALDATSVRLSEAFQLQNLVLKVKASKTLEIGCALGASAVSISEAVRNQPGGKHVVLDPYQEAFGHVGIREIERLGLKAVVEFHPVRSEEFLQAAVKNNQQFDFVFNDGGHGIGQKVSDTFFAERILAVGGILAFHDAFLDSTVSCVRYLLKECQFEIVYLEPDSKLKRIARIAKYGLRHGFWFSTKVVPFTHRSLVAVRKTTNSTRP